MEARDQRTTGGAHTTLASLAALGSMLAASSCCLPLFPFLLAAGAAGTSAFLQIARPYLLVVSILFIAYGFYQMRRAKECARHAGMINSILLWISAVVVIVSIVFPEMLANVAAGLMTR